LDRLYRKHARHN